MAALGLLAAGRVVAQAADDDVKAWLDRMNTAVESLNYRGSFVHIVDGQSAETLEIVHRFQDGEVRERISSPEGAGREILRTARFVRSVFPDKQLVVIEEPQVASLPTASMPSYSDGLASYYELATFTKGQIAGRDTQLVSILARDDYRYGYLLWLDRETALPLKSQVRDEQGDVVEQILFTTISVVDSIRDAEVASGIDTSGFEIRRPDKSHHEAASTEIWAATRLPNGFQLSASRSSLLAGSRYPVQHLVYTDGLATVSVFIAHPLSDADMPEGFSRMGSTNAYSLKIDGRLAVAVGEVPRRTVHGIATSLDAR
jgi:sigma-E factor negative regulatory protein RseB